MKIKYELLKNDTKTRSRYGLLHTNYGTFENYQQNISIQRTDILTIKNSAIKLEGTTDRTNEISTAVYTFNRIKNLIVIINMQLLFESGG